MRTDQDYFDLHTQRHIFAMIGELAKLTKQDKDDIHDKIHGYYKVESCHDMTPHQIWDLKSKLRRRINEEEYKQFISSPRVSA